MHSKKVKEVFLTLDNLGIPYTYCSHVAVKTMEECAAVGLKLGGTHNKNLFLSNRQGSEFYLLLIAPDKRFRTAEVSRKLGVSRLSFGAEDKLREYLLEESGAISPLGLIFDVSRKINLVIDKTLYGYDLICFHPCVNNYSVCMRFYDFINIFIPYVGHKITVIDYDADA